MVVTTRLLVKITVLLFYCLSPCALGDMQQSDENLLKAVFIYNFAKFTRWPEHDQTENGSSMKICSIGDDELSKALLRLDGRKIRENPVTIDYIDEELRLDSCRVLYLAQSAIHQAIRITDSLRSKPVLTVSEISGFAESGGMIELYHLDGRIRFKINLQTVRMAGLDLSSRLLKLAVIVSMEQ
jgi:hypothetical protein